MITRVLLFLAILLAPGVAAAASATIDVRGADGKPLAGAVIMIETPKKPAGPIRFSWALEMAQRNVQFDPRVLIVPVGSSVLFPNRDKVRHQVYSFSKPKKFDLKLYGKDETRSIVFDKAGVVALGCNIHDAMNGFIVVVDTPFAMQTDLNGRVVIANLPAGGAMVRLWHPTIRTPDNMLTQAVMIPATGFATTYTVRGR